MSAAAGGTSPEGKQGISKNYGGALSRAFFGRFKRRFRRFTGGKSRNLRLEDAEKGSGKAAGRIFRGSP